MKQARLVKEARELMQLEVADRWWTRMRGLLGRHTLPPGAGLLLAPASSIHTVGMRFAIDLLFIARDGRLVRVVKNVVPCRFALGGAGAWGVIELESGWFDWSQVRVGDHLDIEAMPGR